jgi:hypothetical protein
VLGLLLAKLSVITYNQGALASAIALQQALVTVPHCQWSTVTKLGQWESGRALLCCLPHSLSFDHPNLVRTLHFARIRIQPPSNPASLVSLHSVVHASSSQQRLLSL